MANNDNIKRISGKLSNMFVFVVNVDRKVEKINYLRSNRQFPLM